MIQKIRHVGRVEVAGLLVVDRHRHLGAAIGRHGGIVGVAAVVEQARLEYGRADEARLDSGREHPAARLPLEVVLPDGRVAGRRAASGGHLRAARMLAGMMEKAESEYQELLKKRRIIENDRSQIVKVIDELEVI